MDNVAVLRAALSPSRDSRSPRTCRLIGTLLTTPSPQQRAFTCQTSRTEVARTRQCRRRPYQDIDCDVTVTGAVGALSSEQVRGSLPSGHRTARPQCGHASGTASTTIRKRMQFK